MMPLRVIACARARARWRSGGGQDVDAACSQALVCFPVFFQPAGAVDQLLFGLIMCFATFGLYMAYKP